MKNVTRIDRFTIDGDWVLHPEGYLTCKAYATKTGIFPYMQPDGSCVKELRLESEVFNENSMRTLNTKPVTWLHPDCLVNSQNWTTLAKGHTHNDARKENDFLAITITVNDRSLVEAIQKGEVKELSCGYTCDTDPTNGIDNGFSYDVIQRNIVYNHLAVVPKGRAGSDVCIKLDAAERVDANELDSKSDRKADSSFSSSGGSNMITCLVKNVSVQVPDAVVASQLQAAVRKDEMSMQEMEAAIVQLKQEVELLKGQKAVADETAKAATEELEKTKDSMSEEKMDALVNERLALKEKALNILGNTVKLDGKSKLEIMKDCIAAKLPSVKLDGKSEAFIQGAFETLSISQSSQQNFSTNNHLNFTPDTRNDGTNLDSNSKLSALMEARKNMWKQPTK